jgi:hypothetical protein
MKIFLLDLWHDLQQKRLWPVAAALVIGLVAVPVILAKPAAEPAAPSVPPAASAEDREQLAALTKVKLGEEQVGKGSTLGVFDPSDPFKPPKGAVASDEPAGSDVGPSPSGDAGPAGDTGSGGAGPVGDTGGGGGTTGGGDTGGDTGGGDTGGDNGGGGTTTTIYKYVVDVTFEANGRTRRIKGLEKLDMLPNESSPLLIFLGVTPKGSDAVFLVDSTLEAAGEGRCKPSGSECAFAYIGAGSEHVFSEEDGDTYTVKIDEIRKVRVDTSDQSAKGAKANASVGPQRRFVPPIVADLVAVASDRLENSSNDSESR